MEATPSGDRRRTHYYEALAQCKLPTETKLPLCQSLS